MLPSRIVFLAPRGGASGVGDHASVLLPLLREHVDVVDLRHGAPGEDSVRDIWAYRRTVQRVVRESPPDTLVHAEASGGASPSYWALSGLTVRRTVTIHDAPRPYWFPTLTRGIARLRWVRAGLLRLLSPLHLAMERRLLRNADVLALTDVGASAVKDARLGRHVASTRLLIPEFQPIEAATTQVNAVGLFGHVYRGKGFEQLSELRRLLPADVGLRVAGRGTEDLTPIPGVDVTGPVEGGEVTAWFASVRAVLLPYHRAPIGGLPAIAASGVQAQATAFGTPCLALDSPSMRELADEGGCEVFPDLSSLVERAALLARDDEQHRAARERLASHRIGRPPALTVDAYLRLWDRTGT